MRKKSSWDSGAYGNESRIVNLTRRNIYARVNGEKGCISYLSYLPRTWEWRMPFPIGQGSKSAVNEIEMEQRSAQSEHG